MDITDEKFDLVVEIWNNYMDEYKLWVREHGDEHMDEWKEIHGDGPIIVIHEFAYFLATKFMEWRRSIVEGS